MHIHTYGRTDAAAALGLQNYTSWKGQTGVHYGTLTRHAAMQASTLGRVQSKAEGASTLRLSCAGLSSSMTPSCGSISWNLRTRAGACQSSGKLCTAAAPWQAQLSAEDSIRLRSSLCQTR